MNKEEIVRNLDVNKIKYHVISYSPVYTVEEADKYITGYDFSRVKNLFLHTANKKILLFVAD